MRRQSLALMCLFFLAQVCLWSSSAAAETFLNGLNFSPGNSEQFFDELKINAEESGDAIRKLFKENKRESFKENGHFYPSKTMLPFADFANQDPHLDDNKPGLFRVGDMLFTPDEYKKVFGVNSNKLKKDITHKMHENTIDYKEFDDRKSNVVEKKSLDNENLPNIFLRDENNKHVTFGKNKGFLPQHHNRRSEDSSGIVTVGDMKLTSGKYKQLYGNQFGNFDGGNMLRRRRNAIKDESERWTDKTVPFRFSPGHFSTKNKLTLIGAMSEWEDLTCLKFKPVSSNYMGNSVLFKNGNDGCYTYPGMLAPNQPIVLSESDGCINHAVVVHEIGHVIGILHEHQRPDRDDYVTVYENNLQEGAETQFTKENPESVSLFNLPYDYYSIMHYRAYAFAKNRRRKTMTTKGGKFDRIIGNSKNLSFNDAMLANRMYRCSEHCDASLTCPDGAYKGKDCRCYCKPAGSEYGVELCDGSTTITKPPRTTTVTPSTKKSTREPTRTTTTEASTREPTTTTTKHKTTTTESSTSQPTTTTKPITTERSTSKPTTTTKTTTTEMVCRDRIGRGYCAYKKRTGACSFRHDHDIDGIDEYLRMLKFCRKTCQFCT